MFNRNVKCNCNNKLKLRLYATTISILTFVLGTNAVAQQQVNFEVIGTVQSHCAFDDNTNQTSPRLSNIAFDIDPDDRRAVPRDKKMGISLTCNAPFSLTIMSSHGGLKNSNANAKAIGGEFTQHIGYQATVNITTEDTSTPIVLTCQSGQMVGETSSCRASSGSNTAIGDGAGVGEVSITLSDSSQKPLQGRYQDIIFLALALQ